MLGIIPTSLYLMLKTVEKTLFNHYREMLEKLISAEVMSFKLFPHFNYNIICGAGLVSNVFAGQTHSGLSLAYKGKHITYYTVKGFGYRAGRRPYMPIVPALCNAAVKSWYGTTVIQTGGPSPQIPWLTRINFKCYNNGVISTPPININDFSFGPQVMNYLDFVLPHGLILGPPAIWSVSLVISKFTLFSASDNYNDAQLAMTHEALTKYDRVE